MVVICLQLAYVPYYGHLLWPTWLASLLVAMGYSAVVGSHLAGLVFVRSVSSLPT